MISLLCKFVKSIFPAVKDELSYWKGEADKCPDRFLSKLALSSIDKKAFHALGGCIYALYPGTDMTSLVRLITAYQTISDYLDNLCDSGNVYDENAFSYLHLALTDALDNSDTYHDYYKYYPYKDDGNYLKKLVYTCRDEIHKLPSFNTARPYALAFALYYNKLQTYKHLLLEIREKKLLDWAKSHAEEHSGILPYEFSAASGSTLGIFMLFAISSKPYVTEEELKKIKDAYFPWVCGLHILLDYFIDINEDNENSDLNFITYYEDEKQILSRLNLFVNNSLHRVYDLKYNGFHKAVIYGMLALYLSDNKAYLNNTYSIAQSIIKSKGYTLRLMHFTCRRLRNKGII